MKAQAVVENSAETDSVLTDPESVLTPPNICATCATCTELGPSRQVQDQVLI